jgi:RimJ/RimL family protein N-acetyltransferase
VLTRVILFDDDVAGTIGSWGDDGEREVTYWIGRSYWGKGIATAALHALLAVDRSRPLHAHVAADNLASRRVLEKCGFRVIATARGVAGARSAEIEELVLRLDELAYRIADSARISGRLFGRTRIRLQKAERRRARGYEFQCVAQ